MLKEQVPRLLQMLASERLPDVGHSVQPRLPYTNNSVENFVGSVSFL